LFAQSGAAVPAATLSAQAWLELGKACAGAGQSTPALLAWRRCGEIAPGGALAPQAWLLAARLYDEKLGDRKTSDRILREVVKRFPESGEAKFAQKRLAAAGKA
jgi:hypothetical protein